VPHGGVGGAVEHLGGHGQASLSTVGPEEHPVDGVAHRASTTRLAGINGLCGVRLGRVGHQHDGVAVVGQVLEDDGAPFRDHQGVRREAVVVDQQPRMKEVVAPVMSAVTV